MLWHLTPVVTRSLLLFVCPNVFELFGVWSKVVRCDQLGRQQGVNVGTEFVFKFDGHLGDFFKFFGHQSHCFDALHCQLVLVLGHLVCH